MKFAYVTPLFAAMALMFSGTAYAQTGAKIATVNAAKVFNEIQETKDLKSKMEGDQKKLQADDLDKKTKLKDLQSARDALKPDAPQYDDASKQLMQAAVEYKVWGEVQTANIQRMQKTQMLGIFNRITAAVGEVAAQKSLDLVIAEQKPEVPDNIDQLTVEQVRAIINERNVLFSSPAVDISDAVIAAMDAKYKAGK